MTRRFYPRPPIVEAVIDFRFASEVQGDVLLQAFENTLGERYGGERRRQDLLEFSASLAADVVETSTLRRPHLTWLQSRDGLRLLGCGNGALSVHVLAPYPGWDSFLGQAQEAIHVLPGVVRSEYLNVLAVRYIDRISLPMADRSSFNDYFTVMPPRQSSMPVQLSGFHVVTQTHDPDDGTSALLTIASAPPDQDGHPVVVYDLIVQRSGTPLCGLDGEAWVAIIDDLHERQRAIFEESITERMRELFL